MNVGDIPGWINVLIGVIGIYFLFQTYRKDFKKNNAVMEPSAMPREPWLTPRRQFGLWLVLVLLAWGSAGFSFYLSRPKDQPDVPTTMSFLPIIVTEFADRMTGFNIAARVDGSNSAIGAHWQSKVSVVDKALSNAEIDATFQYLQTLGKADDTRNFDSETSPGEINWITADDMLTKEQYSKVTNGSTTAYLFVVVRYRDKTLSRDKWVATEGCFYSTRSTSLHLCEHHNRVRFSD